MFLPIHSASQKPWDEVSWVLQSDVLASETNGTGGVENLALVPTQVRSKICMHVFNVRLGSSSLGVGVPRSSFESKPWAIHKILTLLEVSCLRATLPNDCFAFYLPSPTWWPAITCDYWILKISWMHHKHWILNFIELLVALWVNRALVVMSPLRSGPRCVQCGLCIAFSHARESRSTFWTELV